MEKSTPKIPIDLPDALIEVRPPFAESFGELVHTITTPITKNCFVSRTLGTRTNTRKRLRRVKTGSRSRRTSGIVVVAIMCNSVGSIGENIHDGWGPPEREVRVSPDM